MLIRPCCRDDSRNIQELLDRIEQLETALSQATAPPGSHISSPSTRPLAWQSDSLLHDSPARQDEEPITVPNAVESVQLASLKPHTICVADSSSRCIAFPSSQLGQNWYFKGIPILSEKGQRWISSKTGERIALERFHLFRSQADSLLPSYPVIQQDVWELPDRTEVQNVLNLFFRSSFRLVFPVLDPILIEETLETAYEAFDAARMPARHIAARAHVLATASVLFRLTRSEEPSLAIACDGFAARAQLLLGLIPGEVGMIALEAVLMLVSPVPIPLSPCLIVRELTFTYSTRISPSSASGIARQCFHAVACRMICELGGHNYCPRALFGADVSWSERQDYHIRKLFWLCYMLDKDVSLRCGHPPILTEDHCDLTPLHDPMYGYLPEAGSTANIDLLDCREPTWDLPRDPTLTRLKEKTCRTLYSPEAFRATDSQLIHRIRQLDEELESWRLSVPSEFRPKLSVPSDIQLPVSSDMAMPMRIRQINLQLEYHNLLTVIHTTVRRCGADTPEADGIAEDLYGVVHSSIDLALEASRSTLEFLKACIPSIAEEAFW